LRASVKIKNFFFTFGENIIEKKETIYPHVLLLINKKRFGGGLVYKIMEKHIVPKELFLE
jgi:hypothetical protein